MPLTGYFIDANLLVLLVVGSEDRALIDRHRRLRDYTAADFDALLDIVGDELVLVTPNTLTEASNLLGQHRDPQRSRLYGRLRWLIEESKEIIVRSADAASNGAYGRLGLTDAALLEVATAGTPVVTADVALYHAALAKDRAAAVNFVHHRSV